MHYENLLGFLQMQDQRPSDDVQSYNRLYMFLSDIIYFLLQERHLRNVQYIERTVGYLDGIRYLVKANNPLWIFSLNHDLIIECFAADAGIPIKSGFTEETISLPRRRPDGTVIGYLKAEVLPAHVLKYQELLYLNQGQTGINLLKIHGSLDMFTFRDGRDVLKLLPYGEGLRGVLSSLRLANRDLRYVAPGWPDKVRVSNEIAYADESGEMQFLRRSLLAGAYKFDPHHSQVIPNEFLSHFRRNLNSLTALLCIGYGFGDQHINQVIREWLEFSNDHYLTIVDPNRPQIPDEIRHLAPQVKMVLKDCTDYLDKIGGITRQPIDHVARRFGAWRRGRGSEADAMLREFIQEETNLHIGAAVEWAKKLPMRDGGVDMVAMDMTVEELSRAMTAEITVLSPAEVLGKFLEEQTMKSR